MNHSLFAIKKYKNNVADKYIFVQKEEIGNLNNNAYFCSRKYDGQLWFAIKEQDQISIVNASQRDITKQLGHITDQLSQKLKSVENIIRMGEDPNSVFNVGCPSIDAIVGIDLELSKL